MVFLTFLDVFSGFPCSEGLPISTHAISALDSEMLIVTQLFNFEALKYSY